MRPITCAMTANGHVATGGGRRLNPAAPFSDSVYGKAVAHKHDMNRTRSAPRRRQPPDQPLETSA